MTEVLFYHLTHSPLERNLPDLLAKSLTRGWRVLVRCGSEAGMGALDGQLWSYRDDAFLPHGTPAMGHAERQPVLLTCGRENSNRANVLMLVLGARAAVGEMAAFERVCLLFDGGEAASVAAAREDWKAVTAAGLPARYWAQEGGRWVEKAAAGR